MNSKQPELTIFNGAPSIHIDNNQPRIEEEEAIEDHRRRQEELQAELEKEFGNMTDTDEDDENGTMNSTRNDQSLSIRNNYNKDFPLRDEFSNLRNLVETKSRELEHVSNILADERKRNKAAVDEYEKRLSIAEAEKERALMNRNQTHELLVENKGKLIELNEKNQNCMSKIKSLENENERLVGEIESTKIMLSDVQTKYGMVEKNVLFNAERSTDLIIKQSQERHNAQMAMMQQQIDTLKNKYDDLEHEYKHLDIRYKELQRSREAILIEKSETINMLNRNLEDSQRQCQALLSRPDLAHENRRLQNALQTMEYQNEELSITVNKLQKKVQEQTSELEMMDSVINECDGNNQSFTEVSKFLHRDPLKNINSTPMTPEARINKVKEELCRSVNSIKRKREEIKILEMQLAEKDKEIEELRKDESKTLIELNKYREDAFRYETKFNSVQKELDKAQNELRAYSNLSSKEQQEMCKELEQKKQECEELRGMIEELKATESEISNKLAIEQKKLEELTSELVETRNKQVNVDKLNKSIQIENDKLTDCKKCEEYIMKIGNLELYQLQLQNSNGEYLTEMNNLKHDINEAHETIDRLQAKIKLQDLRDKEIDKLQEKAKEFETFMRSKSTRKDSAASTSKESSTNTSHTISNSSEESDTKETNLAEKKYNETKIRDEMARIFANQIKVIEKRFVEDIKKLQIDIATLSNELENKTAHLETAKEQLELLKFTIVHERQEFDAALNRRDEIYKQNIEKYQKHVAELNSQIDMIDDERKLIQNLKHQIEDEQKLLMKREEDTLQKLKKLQQDSTKIIEELNEKYKELKEKYEAAKKTAQNYKQYSDDKEKYYRSECERIKNGYAEAVEKIQSRVNDTLKEREQQYNEKLKRIEQEYEFKIDVLKGMLEKSQK
ncbi:putative leucine-rich repeat-containing protein DDB_G0290503 [Chironomus tepperi]|uniref:putative leucine-rich repeat-containing protein DDB_G0290503 n=1 Tax=Chironomus tepperi TaxID=113505 RepID=UPI00391F6173